MSLQLSSLLMAVTLASSAYGSGDYYEHCEGIWFYCNSSNYDAVHITYVFTVTQPIYGGQNSIGWAGRAGGVQIDGDFPVGATIVVADVYQPSAVDPNNPIWTYAPNALNIAGTGIQVGYVTGVNEVWTLHQVPPTAPGVNYPPITVYGQIGGGSPPPSPTPGPETTCDNDKSGGDAPSCQGCGSTGGSSTEPMAHYSVHSMLVSLNIQDTPLRYSPPYGPAVDFAVTYNQRDTQQPATFSYSNLGPKWTFGWLSYVSDDPASQLPLVGVYRSGGGAEIFNFDYQSQSFTPDRRSHAVLVKTGPNSYERQMPDGSRQVFGLNDGSSSYPRRIFMTQVIDAQGNAVSIGYDSSFRMTTLTDALNQVTTLSYELGSDPLKITKVTDPFGRFATFDYTNGQLTTITDEIGIQSQFGYLAGTDFINSLTTPYGTTTFTSGENGTNRWLEATDPLGAKERVEYRDNAPGISTSDPTAPAISGIANYGLDVANTFYWDKKAMSVAPGDYTKATIKHWLLSPDGSISGILSSEKKALENRIWYTYSGQQGNRQVGTSASPSQVARVLGDGSTQLTQFEYNSGGLTTKNTDPIGRVTSYIYGTNNIDLLEIRQTTGGINELQRKFTYNALHEPLTDTDAAGQTTTYTYNAQGQVLTRQNAKNETTTYAYGGGVPTGYLASITGPVFNGSQPVISFTYDAMNRLRTVTDSDNYTVTTDYDNLDRKTKITYPGGTYEQFKYTDNVSGVMTLDLTGSRDRRGRWTYRHYNANRKMDSITDPLNRTTNYGWCTCGALNSITDANSHITTFNRDLQSRVYQKVFHDGKSISYLYDGQTAANTAGASSRLKSMTDAKGQRTNYAYFADDNIQQITYTDSSGNALNPPTPSVNFTYDPNYNRVKTMVGGTGTTTYGYNPITAPPALGAGQLASVAGPLANSTITYGYDELGRVTNRSINGAANASSSTYDSLGRKGSNTNRLGAFNYSYVGVTGRLDSVTSATGPATSYTYFPNSADKRLQTINNTTASGTLLSKFDYVYDADGQITSLTRQLGAGATPIVWSNGSNPMGDAADQLNDLIQQQGSTSTTYAWRYDNAGNLTSYTGGTFSYNNVNQLTNASYSYDNNGSETADPGDTYEWDAANRLTAINYTATGARSEFTYDGLGRRVKIVEKAFVTPINFNVQPAGTAYGSFSSPNVSLAGALYVLSITGLDPNGGNNQGLVDAVKYNSTLVPTSGAFETPALAANSWAYHPTGWGWNYSGNAGIARNGSAVVSGNPVAPEGVQVGFIVNYGSIWRTLNLAAGIYNINLRAAQRATGNASYQKLNVKLQMSGLQVISTKQFVWDGNTPTEERDASNNVIRRFYSQGEQISGSSYFYTRDHLGSNRELIDSMGQVQARYDYSPWGYRTKLSGTLEASFAFTGHYFHAPSSLNLALYRAYDYSIGRWLSRDPIGEAGGLNLYGYVLNNPLNAIDPLGLDTDIIIHRNAPLPGQQPRDANGAMTVFHNGTFDFSSRVNQFGYQDGTHGIYPGDYSVRPRSDAGRTSNYPNGTPAVTAPGQDNPGNAGAGYRYVFIHPEADIPEGDSRGCLTVPSSAAARVRSLMDADQALGQATRLHIFNWGGVPYALPGR